VETLRNPTEVLRTLSEKSRDKSYKFQRLYRNLYNPEFYYPAYNNICSGQGNMTEGVDGQTIDGMSAERIERIIASLKDHSYQPNPARRTYIEKKNSSKKRPLGIPSAADKLVQEVVRMILESIYEPTFSPNSHGFRPQRSCHTALKHIDINFKGAVWFVEGDIKACFDSFDHQVMVNALRKRIDDEYFIALIWKFLRAGYMEQWKYYKTYSGTPQGSGISPILANIYLDILDSFMESYKKSFDTGNSKNRKVDSGYLKARTKYYKILDDCEGKWATEKPEAKIAMDKEIRPAKSELFAHPYYAQCNDNYKSLYYCRYADDFIISVIGSQQDAAKIKADVKAFLSTTLKLEMSDGKTKITHSSDFARFLGYDICISRSNSIKYNDKGVAKREYSGRVMLYVPKEKWMGKLLEYHALKIEKDENGKEIWKTVHRGKLINHPDIEIITKFNAEIRGLYNYYRLANNVSVLNKFAHIMEYSLYKTFACKYRSTVSKMIDKYSRDGVFAVPYSTKAGMKKCEFYHDGFKRKKEVLLAADTLPEYGKKQNSPTSNAARIKRGMCELCGKKSEDIRMHHVRKLNDLKGQNDWDKLMIKMRRKSLAVCKECHERIHT
jgi:group II intron reverse transcriptase/maturase